MPRDASRWTDGACTSPGATTAASSEALDEWDGSDTDASHVGSVLGKAYQFIPVVGFCSSLNGHPLHLHFEGIGGTNIGPNSLYSWLLSREIWTGTLLKTEPTCEASVRELLYHAPLRGT